MTLATTRLAVAVSIGIASLIQCAPSFAQSSAKDAAAIPSPNDTQAAPAKGAAPAAPSTGDQPAPTQMAEIAVTGQLAAIMRAESVKRDAIGVVDSVSAEEAGKFPDSNVADALQRVPGVSVDRGSTAGRGGNGGTLSAVGGESSQVSIRGLGPTFVGVLLNGRPIASDTTDRSFNFDMLPPELISLVEVHKTYSADLSEANLGGTVNVILARPLDAKTGWHASASIAGTSSSLDGSDWSKVAPRAYGLVGWKNEDSTFAWYASLMLYKRNDERQIADTEGWSLHNNFSYLDPSNPALKDVAFPHAMDAIYTFDRRERRGFSFAADWSPNDRFKVKWDTVISNYKNSQNQYFWNLASDTRDVTAMTVDANGTPLSFTRNVSAANPTNPIVAIQGYYPRNSYLYQHGLNLSLAVSDSTTIESDTSVSRAWDKIGKVGNFTLISGPSLNGSQLQWVNPSVDQIPYYKPSSFAPLNNLNQLHTWYEQNGTGQQNISDSLLDSRLHMVTNFTDGLLSKLDFGFEGSDRDKKVSSYTPGLNGNNIACAAFCGQSVYIPADAIGAYLRNFGSSVVGGVSPGMPTSWVVFNGNQYLNWITTPAAYNELPPAVAAAYIAALKANGGGLALSPTPGAGSGIREKIYSFYVNADFRGNIHDMPWTLQAGARYEYATDTASGYVSPLIALTPLVGTTTINSTFGGITAISKDASNAAWLPAVNFRLNLRDDLVFRLGASKTLTRPDPTALGTQTTFGSFFIQSLQVFTGNTALKPYASKNFDTGLEWYFDEGSYLAGTVFYKKVSDFIATLSAPEVILGYTFQHFFPANLNSGTIKGAELTFNYRFTNLPSPFDGLGILSNYTHVTSSGSSDPAALTSGQGTFAIPGIGDSANFSLYYEKGPWEARAAINWRDKYLLTLAGASGSPTTVKPYSQLDASASYKLRDNIALFVEGTNLTRNTAFWYQAYPNRPQYAEADGMTLTLGIRGSW
jgi:TonB-dependent receptor